MTSMKSAHEGKEKLRIDTKALFLHVYHICHHCYVTIQFNISYSTGTAKCLHFNAKFHCKKAIREQLLLYYNLCVQLLFYGTCKTLLLLF